MKEEMNRIVADLKPLKKELPAQIIIGRLKLIINKKTSGRADYITWTMDRRQGRHLSTYQVNYTVSHCIDQIVFVVAPMTQLQIGQSDTSQGFTMAAVESFTRAMDDKNPIHQGPYAIVPGLLLLEKALTLYQDLLGHSQWTCHVKFRHPLGVGSPYVIHQNGLKLQITTKSNKEIMCMHLEEL